MATAARELLTLQSSYSIVVLHTLGKGEIQVQFLLGAPISWRSYNG